jgi:hypothetical protein
MFLLYHSDGCNTSETVFHWCYVNDLRTTHAVVCWVTTQRNTNFLKWYMHLKEINLPVMNLMQQYK